MHKHLAIAVGGLKDRIAMSVRSLFDKMRSRSIGKALFYGSPDLPGRAVDRLSVGIARPSLRSTPRLTLNTMIILSPQVLEERMSREEVHSLRLPEKV